MDSVPTVAPVAESQLNRALETLEAGQGEFSSKANAEAVAGPSSDFVLNRAIDDHATLAHDWRFAPLHLELSIWANRNNNRFFGGALPPAAISLDEDNTRVLGTYRLSRDGLALNYRININTKHLLDREHSDILRTLCHEQIHQWEHINGKTSGGRYHTKAFRDKAEEIGIPTDRNGISLGITPEGPFARFLAEYDVHLHVPPAPIRTPAQAQARSTICPWACSCTRAWVARHTTLVATCGKCGRAFVRAEPSVPGDAT
jgi:hypothetical protein